MEEFEYTDEMKSINNDVWTGDNIFITGGAGVGKSSLIGELNRRGLKFMFLAPTGLISANGVVKGRTIHSFFKVPFKFADESDIKPLSRFDSQILSNVDAIVIDEISMVRSDVFNFINKSLQYHFRNTKPFGGKQIILVGDLFQLPPVVTSIYEKRMLQEAFGGRYFFETEAFKEGNFKFHELTKVFRQTDEEFINILNGIKLGNITQAQLDKLNTRAGLENPEEDGIIVTPTNKGVDTYNRSMLDYETGKEFNSKAQVDGEFDFKKTRFRENLELKVGCKVMTIANNYEPNKSFVNGDVGKLVSITDEGLEVHFERGHTSMVEKMEDTTEKLGFDEEQNKITSVVIGRCNQYPLTLAYSISVHKSQGMTFSSVVFDKGNGVFDYGQLYVALSRGRSLDTLYLTKKILKEDVFVDNKITEFYKANK